MKTYRYILSLSFFVSAIVCTAQEDLTHQSQNETDHQSNPIEPTYLHISPTLSSYHHPAEVIYANHIATNQTIIDTIKIGNQTWMAQNLCVSKFLNGDSIPEVRSKEEWYEAWRTDKPAWCYYNNDPSTEAKFGKLYTFAALVDSRGIVPIGWHIPEEHEWLALINQLKELKKSDHAKFKSLIEVFHGGSRDFIGNFPNELVRSSWWTFTEDAIEFGKGVTAYYDRKLEEFELINELRMDSHSVRCIKD